MELGQNLKTLRLKQRMTLKQLAQKSGVSVGLVSQIERSLSAPTVTTLQKIAKAFGVTMSTLFMEDETLFPFTYRNGNMPNSNQVTILRKDRRKKVVTPWGIWHELLCPDLRHRLEVIYLHYPVGMKAEEFYNHEGEECGIVLQGRIMGSVGDQTITLEEGDSIHYESSIPHRWENAGQIEATAIWAITPPSY